MLRWRAIGTEQDWLVCYQHDKCDIYGTLLQCAILNLH